MQYSIMIMTHNNEEMLEECLNRIESYTPFGYDLIIVDDASDTPCDIRGATIVRMPNRSNCCNLRNVGMEMAQTPYVFWLDNDTMVGHDWYKPLIDIVENDETVGLTGQPKDARLIRKPFLPINQSDCMIEYQFAYDYDHHTRMCDFITSYAVLVKKDAWRPTYCYNMPTPILDPDLGACVKSQGYSVKVADTDCNLTHIGSATPRPGGREYQYHLAENFTKWFKFWEPQAAKVFELYKGRDVAYQHDANEPFRSQSRNTHGALDEGPYYE